MTTYNIDHAATKTHIEYMYQKIVIEMRINS